MKVVERDDLVRRLSGVLEIAATTVRVLLSESSEPTTSAEEPRPEKVLSETALLLLFGDGGITAIGANCFPESKSDSARLRSRSRWVSVSIPK